MNSVRLRLSAMMFLQYFVWGAWFVTLGTFIGAHTGEEETFASGFTGVAYGTAAIGAMIAPFFVGMIADRFFASQRVLGVLHLVGAGLLLYLSTILTQQLFYFVLIAYFICYMPTLSLTNSLSFHHLSDPGKQFPAIRVLGTIGWIVAGNLYFFYAAATDVDINAIEATTLPMKVASVASVLLGIYCFFLPHTPPPKKGEKVTISDVLGLDALRLMKRWSFAVFVIGSFLVAIPLQFYYNYTNFFLNSIGIENAVGMMTLGQGSEIFFMLLMPFFFVRLGVKYMLLVGMAAWTARYVLFAYGTPDSGLWMLYLGILLHGVCYDFFFVTGQIYVDEQAHKSIRGAAQGFIAFVTLGCGAFVGALLSGVAESGILRTGDELNWTSFWLLPAAGAGVVLILFAIFFREEQPETAPAGAEDKHVPDQAPVV